MVTIRREDTILHCPLFPASRTGPVPWTAALNYLQSLQRIYAFWRSAPGTPVLDSVRVTVNKWHCPTTEAMGRLRFLKLNLLRDSQHRIKITLYHSHAGKRSHTRRYIQLQIVFTAWTASSLTPLGHQKKAAFFSEWCFELARIQLHGNPFKMKMHLNTQSTPRNTDRKYLPRNDLLAPMYFPGSFHQWGSCSCCRPD